MCPLSSHHDEGAPPIDRTLIPYSRSWVSTMLSLLCGYLVLTSCGLPDRAQTGQAGPTASLAAPSGTPTLLDLVNHPELRPTRSVEQETAYVAIDLQDTAIAHAYETAAARPTLRPDATLIPLPTEPSPPEVLGIYNCGTIDKNNHIILTNCWRIHQQGNIVEVQSGGTYTGGVNEPVYGVIAVCEALPNAETWIYCHEHRTNSPVGLLHIIAANGMQLILQSETGVQFLLDVENETLTPLDSNGTPIPATPTSTPVAFPSTSILDSFTRADGPIGSNWLGATQNYSIATNTLQNVGGNTDPIFWQSSFGADQEVFMTITSMDTTASEVDLVLKAQDTTPCNLIEVWYQPSRGTAQVWTCHNWGTWTQHGSDIPLSLAAGDQFGARAQADGTVTVYKNGTAVGSATIDSSWPYVANSGYGGIWLIDAPGTILDDVGGGARP